MKISMKNLSVLVLSINVLLFFSFTGKALAQSTPDKPSFSIYVNLASPINDYFKEEQKSGFGVGMELIKSLEKSSLSGFVLFQFSNFPVRVKDDFFSNDPFQVISGGVGLRLSKSMENFRIYTDAGLLLSKSNYYSQFTYIVNGVITEEKQFGSEGIFFGGMFSLGLSISFIDIKWRYFASGADVTYSAFCFGITKSF